MSKTAACSRVTGRPGENVVGDVPSTTPVSYAQATASRYQPDAASVNGVVTPVMSGSPAR